MTRVLIAGNLENPRVSPLLGDLKPALEQRGIETVTAQELDLAVPSIAMEFEGDGMSVECGKPVEGVDLVLVLGGDGFMMALTRALGFPTTPFYGVNFGRVGFLINPPVPAGELADLIAGQTWSRASYPVLEADITLADGRRRIERAFNDFVIERASGQTVELLTYIDGVLLNRYSGDGLIVATPGGSTAYSLAAGGPVVHPLVDSMMVTPLCPHRPIQFHSLQFPLLLTLDSGIRVINSDRQKRPCRCVCDGRAVEAISEVAIRHGGLRLELLRGPGYSFVDTLVRKVIGSTNSSATPDEPE